MLAKFAVLCEDYPSDNHPEYVFVQQLVETLINKGVDISVVAPQSLTRSLFRRVRLLPRKSIYQTKQGKTYSVYRPYSISFGNGNKRLYRLVERLNQNQINKVLDKIKPEILYGHFWHVAYKLKEYAVNNAKPLFVACGEGDNALENLVDSLSQQEKTSFVNAINGVISVSTENKRKCIAYGLADESRIVVLPNGVDKTQFYPQDSKTCKKKLGVQDGDFVIAFTGLFVTRKGSKIVAEALNKIGDDSIKAIFIGQPLAGDDCTPHYSGIVYCGKLNHDKIPEYLNCADVFVLPTLKEGCCNAIVEALACGIPVISSNRAFNDDILNESNSIRIDPESVDDVAAAILKMKNDKVKYEQMKSYAVAHAGSYSIDVRADRIIDFINSKLHHRQ